MRLGRELREVHTPEGVVLEFELGDLTERVGAFFIDFFIVHVAVLLLFLLTVVSSGGGVQLALSVAFLASFFLRNFYYTYFEIRWGGATPGKRRLKLRVIARDGGLVDASAILARNLTREFEVFLPLGLAAGQGLLPGLPPWAALVGGLWCALFALLPLLTRDKLRVGDLVGGTLVVRMPDETLMRDMAAAKGLAREREKPAIAFSREQLGRYGIHELQVLEGILRGGRGKPEREIAAVVAERIKKKIGWKGDEVSDWLFLSEFYKAQRAWLERGMLFGERKEKKS